VIRDSVVSKREATLAAFFRAVFDNLGWVDNTSGQHVNVVTFVGVEAFCFGQSANTVDDYTTIEARVFSDAAKWVFENFFNDANASFFVTDKVSDFLEGLFAA